MKKVMTIVAVSMFILASSVAYAGQFGPPEPTAKEGKVSLGLGYFFSSAKWKTEAAGWRTLRANQNQVYLQASYGFVENWEVFSRAGGADLKLKDTFDIAELGAFAIGEADFKEGLRPFGTIGIKGVFDVTPSFGIGPFFHASLYSNSTDKRFLPVMHDDEPFTVDGVSFPPGTYTVTETFKIKQPSEINLGIGLQGKIGNVIVYGGPFAYWTRAKAYAILTLTGPITRSFLRSTIYKEENNIGGFAGLRVPLGKGLNFEVEGQLKSMFSIGGALTYAF